MKNATTPHHVAPKARNASENNDENGFTLIELLIAMTIFLTVTAAVWGVLNIGTRTRALTNQQSEASKVVRTSLNLIARDTYNAGYGYPSVNTGQVLLPDDKIAGALGIPADADNTSDAIAPVIAGNNITLNNINQTANTRTDQVTFLFQDTSFNSPIIAGQSDSDGNPLRVSQSMNVSLPAYNGSSADVVTLKTAYDATCAGQCQANVNDLFLVGGASGAALAVATRINGSNIEFGNGDLMKFNSPNNGLSGVKGSAYIKRVTMVTFFVAADGTLTRRSYANFTPTGATVAGADYVDQPLAYGVQDFQIQYVLADGTTSSNPGANGNWAAMYNVRQINFTISVRSADVNAGTTQPLVINQISSVSTRNMGYVK